MIFNSGYYHPMDREYGSPQSAQPPEGQTFAGHRIEEPISANYQGQQPIGVKDIGQSVTEGQRFGAFRQSVNAAIRVGARKVELQTQMGGGAEPVGAENYGKQAREELREIAKANQIEFNAVHAPTQIGNLSGFSPRQGGGGDFNDEQRLASIEEIKKAINFAADVAQGGAVVVHTGEWQRPMVGQQWAYERDKNGQVMYDRFGDPIHKFLAYEEEPARAVYYMVDDRNGKVIGDVRRSQTVREPVYITAGDYRKESKNVQTTRPDGSPVRDTDWVDADGNYINPDNIEQIFKRQPKWNADYTRFDAHELSWKNFERRAQEYNERHAEEIRQGKLRRHTPSDQFFKTQIETQVLQARGSSLFHGRQYDGYVKSKRELEKAMKFYKEMESQMPKDELWKITKSDQHFLRYVGGHEFIPPENKLPSQIIEGLIEDVNRDLKFVHEASASADAQAETSMDNLKHVVPVESYAEDQSLKSYAEVGIHAMHQSDINQHCKRDIYVAPENIFPEFGYGSHPEELIELVQGARKKMVDLLTKKKIEDLHGRKYSEADAQRFGMDKDMVGKPVMVDNPYYQPKITKELAEKEARDHIKSTFDTQHLGMWRKHFQPKYNDREGRMETKQETDARFKNWYMDQVNKMHKEGIIGHIHLVDGMGSGHHHLPAGQGEWPVVDAVKYLKSKGYDLSITSEGHGEEQMSQGRILTETWKAFGSPVYGAGEHFGSGGGAPGGRWGDIHHSYFGQNRPPYYIFGSYAPSNDWTLWSQVPLE